MNKFVSLGLSLIILLSFLGSCGSDSTDSQNSTSSQISVELDNLSQSDANTAPQPKIDPSNIPAYSGKPYIVINNNVPYFTKDEITPVSFEAYSELDELGRSRQALASVGRDIMPTEKRGSMGQVKPSGWQTEKYDCIDGKYLYNRCHILGYQLTGENSNEKNLITGTRYLNVDGMLPFENMIADYVKETNNHVMYRVTPVYTGENLVADGVLMEGYSVEDEGAGVLFCVFAYNVQPGVTIDYVTGQSVLGDDENRKNIVMDPKSNFGEPLISKSESKPESEPVSKSEFKPESKPEPKPKPQPKPDVSMNVKHYILNTNTLKFHIDGCRSLKNLKPINRMDYNGTRESVIDMGYSSCGICMP